MNNNSEKEIIKEIVFSNFSSLLFLLFSDITVSKLILLYLIEHVIVGFFDSLKILISKLDSITKISAVFILVLIYLGSSGFFGSMILPLMHIELVGEPVINSNYSPEFIEFLINSLSVPVLIIILVSAKNFLFNFVIGKQYLKPSISIGYGIVRIFVLNGMVFLFAALILFLKLPTLFVIFISLIKTVVEIFLTIYKTKLVSNNL